MDNKKPIDQKILKFVTLAICLPAIPYFIYLSVKDGSLDNFGGLLSIVLFSLGFVALPIFLVLYPKKVDKISNNIKDKLAPTGKKIDKFGDEVVVPAIGGFIMLCFRVLFVVACLYGLRTLVRFLIY